MVRSEGVHTESLMTSAGVADHLLKSCPTLKNFESFMFGSSLNGIGSDVDILIIGPAGEPLNQLKKEIAIAGRKLPLDVLYMLPSEAKETAFVVNEGCVRLSRLTSLG